MKEKISKGRHYSNKGTNVFVASNGGGNGCPTINLTITKAKFRDDYYNKLKISKKLAKLIFD